ncbi:MAG: HDIG domain-containing metalloprotein [Chloroflexota bacterium]
MSANAFDVEDRVKPLTRILKQMGLLVFFLALSIGLTVIMGTSFNRRDQINLSVGDRSPRTVTAPRSLTYVSDVLTAAEQDRIVSSIYEYTPLDRGIGREQSNRAREVFRFVVVVRVDSLTSDETKLEYLQSINNLEVTPETAELLINMSPDDFAEAQSETLSLISSVMLRAIRPEQLPAAERDTRSQISFNLSQDQEQIVSELAPQFIVANQFFDEEATAVSREEAASTVEPVQQVITEGQTVITVGSIVTEEHIETLERLGILQQEGTDWYRIGSAFLIATISALILMIYWWRFMDRSQYPTRHLLILLFLMLAFTAGARLALFYNLLYLFPMAGLAMLLVVILNTQISIMVVFIMSMLVGFMAGQTLEPAVLTGFGAVITAMTLRDRHRFGSYFRAGAFGVVGNLAVTMLFNLSQTVILQDVGLDLFFGIINGLFISPIVTIASFFIVGLFGIITVVQLQDLSRLDHPLLQELLRKAPGTYHHSIMVANLAEQAAERIGANGTLVRVGSFYHDIGKMDRPQFFSENQAGRNPHDSMSPYTSAEIVLGHVTDGLEKARKARLPLQIQNFIAEHHGRGVVKFFYEKARQMAGEHADTVDINLFRYVGPRPRSKETGIVLLADTVEAASTAVQPETEQEIEKLVISLIDSHVKDGQLDRSGLSLGDLSDIRESFIENLKGRYHIRVKYPGNDELTETEEAKESEEDPSLSSSDNGVPIPLLPPEQQHPLNGNNGDSIEPAIEPNQPEPETES